MQTLVKLSQEEGAQAQERIDLVEINSDFKLAEAISSLRFYWNLAKHHKQPLTVELWAESGAIVPSKLHPEPLVAT